MGRLRCDIMADIIITIPKTRKEEWLNEVEEAKKQDMDLWFKTSSHPRRLTFLCYGKCYVVLDGNIIGYHEIKTVKWSEGFTCEITENEWPKGWYVVRWGKTWTPITPVPMKGFQGFRYVKEKLEGME